MVTARAKFDKLRSQGDRSALAAATLGVIQGYRAKRLYARDVKRIVESIVGKPEKTPMTPMQAEIYQESLDRAEAASNPTTNGGKTNQSKDPKDPKRKAAS